MVIAMVTLVVHKIVITIYTIYLGIMTLQDLKDYKVKVRDVVQLPLHNGLTFSSVSAPGGGAVVAMILNIMQGK